MDEESHHTEISDEDVDGVSVLQAGKQPPKLHITTHFENGVRTTPKRHTPNHKLIVYRLGKHPNIQPPNVTEPQRGDKEFRK